ncbi:hypothetical protein N4807_14060, partial [Enterococcus faecalis]|nr:hypothetical protein [Enterococcus faecalis]
KPEHTLYVGDSSDIVIVGARNGGWHSLWFNHRSRELPCCYPASHLADVTCFTELFPTVAKLFSLYKKPLFNLKNFFFIFILLL